MNKKEENQSKKSIIISIIIIILLIIIGVLSYFLFFGNKVTINTNGGKVVQNIEIKDGEITTLPVIEKSGYRVTAYINENKKIVKKGSKITNKTQITPIYVSEKEETIKVTYYDGDTIIDSIELAKGMDLILPEDPIKDGYIFGGWAFSNGMILIGNPVLQESITLKAIWLSLNREMITIKIVSSDNHEKEIANYKQEKGTKLILPSPTKKEGMVFDNWQDTDGNIVNNETIADKDITVFAVFAKYTCPDNCAVNTDGKTCSKIETKNKESKSVCPDGAFEYYGTCITLKGAVKASIRQCDDWEDTGTEMYYKNYCAKRVKKVTKKVCPNGYKADGDICKKETIVSCTKVE